MFTLLIRTVIIYIFLLITMRLMGKRQLGELDISELVSTLLLSDIAALPITTQDIPLSYAIVPILTISFFEIVSSLLLTKIPSLKALFSTRPSVVISRGKINRGELLKNRISIDELICELRQQSITDITQVNYAIIEPNGKMTVIPKSEFLQPTRRDLGIQASDGGLCHIIISDGRVNEFGLTVTKKDRKWLTSVLEAQKKTIGQIFLMTLDDQGTLQIVEKDRTDIKNKKGGQKRT